MKYILAFLVFLVGCTLLTSEMAYATCKIPDMMRVVLDPLHENLQLAQPGQSFCMTGGPNVGQLMVCQSTGKWSYPKTCTYGCVSGMEVGKLGHDLCSKCKSPTICGKDKSGIYIASCNPETGKVLTKEEDTRASKTYCPYPVNKCKQTTEGARCVCSWLGWWNNDCCEETFRCSRGDVVMIKKCPNGKSTIVINSCKTRKLKCCNTPGGLSCMDRCPDETAPQVR